MKIGILSFYYNNFNYGGMLQAYALCKSIEMMGYDVEQIAFDCWAPKKTSLKDSRRDKWKQANICKKAELIFLHMKDKILSKFPKKEQKAPAEFVLRLEERKEAFLRFQDIIPHSSTIYSEHNISNCANNYDVFIVGSDQVWNENLGRPLYLLDFLSSQKLRISYAASIAQTVLSIRQKNLFREQLPKFLGVSVREPDAVDLVKEFAPVSWVLDPTLLLTREQWDSICADRMIDEEYIFCYFLGENSKTRKIVSKFAKEQNIQIVTLPFLLGYKKSERKFGDVHLFDVSPDQFISLIKHAKYVFTDSFHAAVFSNIYEKSYAVFNRDKKGTMNSRIYGLIKIFGQDKRFCAKKSQLNVTYLKQVLNLDEKVNDTIFKELKNNSAIFLQKHLEEAKDYLKNGKN